MRSGGKTSSSECETPPFDRSRHAIGQPDVALTRPPRWPTGRGCASVYGSLAIRSNYRESPVWQPGGSASANCQQVIPCMAISNAASLDARFIILVNYLGNETTDSSIRPTRILVHGSEQSSAHAIFPR